MSYTPGSFTKNFSWHRSYKRLHMAIRCGFANAEHAITRDEWRSRSKIADRDRELIPLNFFLYSLAGEKDDYVLTDRLVEIAKLHPYSDEFSRLSLFAFHLANSGRWRKSKWSDGRVAGWANDFIRNVAWRKDDWGAGAFEESTLKSFIYEHVDGVEMTKRKVFTNYRHMLRSAAVLSDTLQPRDLRQRWLVDAVQLFWDRRIFDGAIPRAAPERVFEQEVLTHEIYRLLRCDEAQGRAFARVAYREYGPRIANRFAQIERLKAAGLIAA